MLNRLTHWLRDREIEAPLFRLLYLVETIGWRLKLDVNGWLARRWDRWNHSRYDDWRTWDRVGIQEPDEPDWGELHAQHLEQRGEDYVAQVYGWRY